MRFEKFSFNHQDIYVSEYDRYGNGGRITLLKPHTGTTAITASKMNKENFIPEINPFKQVPSCDDDIALIFPKHKLHLSVQIQII
jgi:hypothetical protein